MSSVKKVAVVTGSNKGVGFGIVRGLCKQFDGDVFLTSRDEGRGQQAVAELNKEELSPKFHQLDICDHNSIEKLKSFLLSTYGGLDLLVNNAGIAFKNASTAPFSEQAEVTMKTNVFGTLDVCETLFPILRPHARQFGLFSIPTSGPQLVHQRLWVVNVSSMVSQWAIKKLPSERQTKLKDPSLSMEGLKTIMQEFVEDAKSEQFSEKGWSTSAYGMTKLGVSVMTFIQHRMFESDSREDIVINCCCPGYVDTDMTSHKGPKTIDQGADTPLYLALLPPNTTSPKGNYVTERKIEQWG